MPFSTYEHDEARKIVEYRRTEASRPQSRIVEAIAEGAENVTNKVRELPGADRVFELAGKAYMTSLKGIGTALTRSAALSLRRKRLWRRYERSGHTISSWRDIRELDLEAIDSVRPNGLGHRYAIGAGIEGAGSGFLMGGGAIVAAGGGVLGAGAGAAPGIGIAAGVFAADTATTLVSSTRLALHVGSYYGYDPQDELEQLFAAAVLNLGTPPVPPPRMRPSSTCSS